MAEHYGIAVIPTRVRTPQDKSKVEKGVKDVETQVLARLRDKKFFSLEELNREIKILLNQFNRRPFQKVEGCRLSHFEELDEPYLKPLSNTPYVFAEWQKKRVGKNYHINVLGHHYSTSYHFVSQRVDIRITQNIIEIFFKNKRIASHLRSDKMGGYTTLSEHRPANHRFYADCDPECIRHSKNESGRCLKVRVRTV